MIRSTAPARSLDGLPARGDDGCWLAVIEASAGARQKMKYRAEWRAFALFAALPPGLSYPLDFGFVPSTRGDDGDPLDILVLTDEPVAPGGVVPCRLLGVLQAEQGKPGRPVERNDRFLAVAAETHRHAGVDSIDAVAAGLLDAVERFFVASNEAKGVRFAPLGRAGPHEAAELLERGEQRFAAAR